MNKSSRVVVSLVLLGVGVALGWYVPKYFQSQAMAPVTPSAAPATPAAPPAGAQARPRGTPVELALVESVEFPRGLNAIGSLRSNESTMISAEVAGRIAAINFIEGQPVKKGDVLVNLDDAVAQAELAQAQANFALAESRYERSNRLQTAGFVSKEAKEDASNALQLQQATLEVSQARLQKTRIVAPFDGVIGLRNVSVGEYVTAGQNIAPLEDTATLKADFRLPERHIADVQVGQTLEIRVDALPDKIFEGLVYAISPLIEAGGRSILVRATVDNLAGQLRSGMFARVQLITSQQQALVIPESALAPSGQSQYVFRIVEGQAERVLVEIGERRAGLVEIVSGLNDGDAIVVAGLQAVRNRGPVTVLGKPKPSSQVAQEAAKSAEALRVNPS
jgi:membrane fusion protein (multidrug efflux system)